MIKKTVLSILFILALSSGFAQHDSVFTKRFLSRNGNITITYSPDTRRYIDILVKNKTLLSKFLYYKQDIDEAFNGYDVPEELKSYALIASGMEAKAMDDHQNIGWWLMPFNVAKSKGLKINSYVDERMHLKKSSAAFARELKELYSLYNDWDLALAAYASSPTTINKAIREAGGKMKFNELRNFLPEYAQKIVPMFYASVYFTEFYREHGIQPLVAPKIILDSARILKWTPLDLAAQKLNLKSSELEELNPIFRKKLIPPVLDAYYLFFPADRKQYVDALDSIEFSPYIINDYTDELPELPNKNIPIAKKDSAQRNDTASSDTAAITTTTKPTPVRNPAPAKNPQNNVVYYTVKSGDGLYAIAIKFRVSVNEIKKWNNLKNDTIHPGQRLKILRRTSGVK